MKPYSIITLCTKNYRQAYEFVIDSWLRTDVEKIHVYTDDVEWESDNDRIEIIFYFKPCDDWITNVGKKVISCISANQLTIADNIIFIDIDCYITAELGDVFNNEFNFAVTRLNEDSLDASTGIFFFRNNDKARRFFLDWQADQETARKKNRGVKEWCSAYEQIAFSELIRKRRDNGELEVMSLNADWYNRKTRTALIKHDALRDPRLKVLHFYGASFKDSECIKEVNKTLDLTTGKLR